MSLDKTLLGIAKSAVDTQQKSRDGRNVVSKGVDAVTNKSYANEDKKVAAEALRKWENSTWKPKVEAKLKQELKTRAPHLKPGSKAYQQTYDSLFNKNYKDLQSAKAKAQQQIGTLRKKGQTQRQVDNDYSQKEAARNNNTKLQAASSAARDTGEAVSGALATGSSRALRYPLQLAADIGENDDGGIFDRGAKALERHEDNLQQVYPAYADIQQNGNFGQKLALSAVEQIPNLALSFTGAGAAAKGAQLAGAGAKMTAATAYGTAAATMYPQAYGDGNDSTKQELENATPEQLRVAVRSKDIYKGHFDKNIKAGMSEDEAHQKSRDQTISSIAEESGDAVGLATLALSMIAPGVGSFTANQAAGGAVSKFGQKVFNKLAAKADAGKVAKYALPAAVGTGIVGLNVAEEALQEGYTDYKAQQAAVDVGVKDKINQPQLKEAMLMGGILGGAMGGGTYIGTRNSKFQQAQDGLREAQDTYAQAAAIIPQLQQQIEEVSPRSAEGQALTAQLEETKAALSTMAAEAETRGIPKTSLARRAPRIDPTNSFDTDFNGQVDGATELSEQDFENALNPDGTPAPQVTPAAPVMSEQELDIQDAQLAEFIAEQHALDEAIEDGSNDKPVEQSLAEAQNWYDSKRGEGKQGLSGVVSRAAATEQDAAFAQQQEGIKGATASINDYIASERAKQQQIDGQLQQEAEAATTDAEKQAVAQKIEQRDAERAKEDDILEAREQLAQPYENELFDTTIIGADGAPFKLARFWDSSLPAGAKAKAIADAFGGQVDQNVAKSDWANLPEGVQKELHRWFTEHLNGVRQSREGAVAQAGEQVAAPAVEQPQEVAPTASGLTMPVRAEQAPVEAKQGAASYTLDNLKGDISNNYGRDPQAMFDAQKRAEEAGLPQAEINRVIQETISEKVGWTKPAATQLTDENPVINIPAPGSKVSDNNTAVYKTKPEANAAFRKQGLDIDKSHIVETKDGFIIKDKPPREVYKPYNKKEGVIDTSNIADTIYDGMTLDELSKAKIEAYKLNEDRKQQGVDDSRRHRLIFQANKELSAAIKAGDKKLAGRLMSEIDSIEKDLTLNVTESEFHKAEKLNVDGMEAFDAKLAGIKNKIAESLLTQSPNDDSATGIYKSKPAAKAAIKKQKINPKTVDIIKTDEGWELVESTPATRAQARVDSKNADREAQSIYSDLLARNSQKATKKDGSPKYFLSDAKSQQFIVDNDIGATHEVVKNGNNFEIQPKQTTEANQTTEAKPLLINNTEASLVGEQSAPAKRAEAKKAATEKSQNEVAETDVKGEKERFSGNTFTNKEEAERRIARIKSKMGTLNSGMDPEMMGDGIYVAVAYIEDGLLAFKDFASEMRSTLGNDITPYLSMFWESARRYPGFKGSAGMTNPEESARQFDALMKEYEQASTPAKSDVPKKVGSGTQAKTLIGENNEGLPLYEDDRGVRSILEHGIIYVNESVSITPTGIEQNPREQRYLTKEELAQESNNDTEAGTQDKAGAQEVRARGSDPQSGNTQDDSGDVAQGQPTDDSATGQGESTGRSSVRGAGTDVADDGAVPSSENATDGRKGASGEGAPNAGAGKSATGSKSGRVAAVKSPAATAAQATDLLIDNPLEIVGGTPVQRFNRNRAALELLDQLEVEGRQATTEEQKVLAAYIGWGSFGQDLFQGSWEYPKYRDEGVWKERSEWLRNMMGKENWESAQRSITNAHYTDPPTVMAMWDMLARMGFDGGRVLEPSMGTGNFFSMMPADIKSRSQLTGIELDEMTGAIAKQLFPQSNVQIMGYQDSKTPDNFYDVVVGNWPFENTPVADRKYNKFNPMLHDYFFLKTMDQVRPGGIVIGITSAGSMDKKNTVVRGELAKQAELISAIRLPSGAFKDYAGTSVVTDIVILRKRPEKLGMIPKDATWVNIGTYDRTPSGKPVEVNQYYLDNPQNIIGTLDYGSGATQFPGMIVRRPDNMSERLQQAIELVPENVIQEDTTTDHITYYANKTGERHGSLFMQDDKLMLVRGDQAVLAQDVVKYEVKSEKTTKERESQIKDAIDLRRKYSALIDAERANEPAETQRKALKDAYKSFVKNNGPLRDSYALKYMLKANDPFYFELAALEDDAGNHAAIMDKSTTRGMKTLENPSIRDAYVLARNQSVSPSVKEIAKLSKKTEAEVKKELKESGAVIEAPNGDLIPSDIYLSGNVRQKLREAQAAFDDGNKAMKENIAALQNVVPEDIPYFNIETKLGATWVPIEVYQDYLASMLGLDSSDGIEVTFVAGRWKVRLKTGMDHTSAARTNYGTAHYKFSDLAQAAIRNQTIKIMKTDPQGDKYYDAEASNEVNARIGKIREDFGTWLWSDPERRVDLEREYNESRNAWATPKYDGSFLTFEGMALTLGQGEFSLREHQANAIWRAIVNRRSLNAHEVGTGKTFTMGGIAIESRRYGIAKKPIILAHNANSAAVAAEIRMMYPSSRVLYIDNLEPKNRELRLRQIANDDWDAIVMPHSLVDRLSLTEETLMRMAADDIAALEAEFYAAAAEAGIDVSKVDLDDEDSVSKVRSRTAKEMAKTRKRVIEGIKKQAQQASKAGAVSFEDLGIDMILVDEVHEFKKPPIVTSMDMKGLNTDVSQRSIQLQFLTRYVRQMNNGGNVHTFTGTPITNTITEIYHQMRYVMDSEMEKVSVSDWDGWFGSFATEVQDVELTSAGDYEMTTRLAGFINVPELRQMVGQYMDTVFAEDMPEMQPRRTDTGKTMADDNLTEREKAHLLNGRTEGAKDRPYKKVINDTADMTPAQEAAFAEVQRLAGEWRDASGKQKREWVNKNDPRAPFAYTNMAEKASADVRLLDPSLVGKEGQTNDDPNSKTSRAVRNIMEIYHSDKDANQVVFMDKGYNKTATRSTGNRDENKKMIYEKVDVFSPVADMVERLVQSGIPREQIAVVTGSTKKEDRHRIAQAVNNSEIRVVIGSTQTLGVGVNMQRNLRAMHHMDAPYMPGELEQRNGRGQRQGNQWNTVLEYRYMTDRLDGKRWQILAVKQRFITAFMKSNGDTRTIEGDAAAEEQSDILESFSEAAGDPRVLQRVKLQGKQDSLKNKERIYTRGIADMKREIRSQKDRAAKGKEALAKLDPKIVADTLQAQRDSFKATVDGKSFDKRADAIEVANKFVEDNLRLGTGKLLEVGTYAGIPLKADWNHSDKEYKSIIDLGGHRFAGNGIAGLEAVMRNFPKFIEKSQADIDKSLATVKNLEKALDQPFGQAQDLERNIKQLADLQRDLEMNPVPPPAWLRQGAPMDSEVYRNKSPFIVTGHRYDSNGWFVIAEDSKGQVAIPYLEAKDASGMALYDEKDFVAPEVTENKRGKDSKKQDGKNDNELEIDIDEPKFSRMAPNGKPTNLNEQQWLQVRTPAFKEWFGDWENDPVNASKVVDSNGEPMVVYHGSSAKDIDIFRDSPQTNGLLFFTENKGDAVSYSNGEKSGYMDMEYAEDKANLDIARDYLIENGDSDMFNGALLNKNISDETKVSEFAGDSNIGLVEAIGDKLRAGKISLSSAIDEINAFISSLYREGKVYGVFLNVTKPYNSKTNPVSWQEAEKLGSNKLSDSSDGIFVTEDDSDAAIAVYSPNQIKSADDNTGAFDPSNPDIRYSKTNPAKGATGATSQQVIGALQKRFGKEVVAKLVKAGKLRVRSLNDFVNADGRLLIPSDAEGFYYDGKVVLIADNLTADNAVATLLHEMGGHAGIQSMLDPQTYMSLMANFDALVKSGNKYAVRAKERAEASTDSDSEARDEYIPYLITEYAQASERGGAIGVIKRFVNRVMAGVRAWVRNHTGVQLKMTPNDMVQLAERMVKRISEQSAVDMTIADVENMPAGQMQFKKAPAPKPQVDAVRKKYEGTDKWMKAPNGKPTKLNEKQWLQVRTPAFKQWFGDWENDSVNASKILDENGEPLVLYHGAKTEFWTFDMGQSVKERNNGMDGIFFTDNAKMAAGYSVDLPTEEALVKARLEHLVARDLLAAKTRRLQLEGKSNNEVANLTKKEAETSEATLKDFVAIKRSVYEKAFDNAADRTKAVFINSQAPFEQDMKGGNFWDANKKAAEYYATGIYDGIVNDNVLDDVNSEYSQGPVKVVVSFDSTNIKSATDNTGAFDASNADIRYSNKPQFSRRYSNLGTDGKPVTAKEKALDKIALAQATTMSSKFGINLLLRRHLATPQHVALLNPVFKLFTDNIQSRIAYENNEAGLVQTLLPEIWDTRLVVGKKKEAMERVSTAIFDGTMADQVWTDSELETKFNHTRQDIGFYRRARRAIDKSVMNMTVDTLSSLAKGTKLVNMETIQRLKLAGMHPIFHNLALQQHMTDELQKLAKGGLITPKAEARMQKQLDAVFDVMAAVAGKYDKLVEDGYAPLMRFGHYAVEVRDKISNDLDLFELYETKGQQRKAIKELKERYDESQFSVGTGTLNPEGFKQFKNKGLSPETVQLFAAELGLDDDSGYQAYLKIAVSDRSALKRLIHRKKVPGYSEDMPRVLSSFVMSNARYSGRGLYNSEIERSIQNIEDGNLQNEAQKVFENIENPQEEFAQQRSLMFHYFMGFSPAFFFLNLTQPFTQTIPKLTAYAGAAKGHAYMAQALGIVGKNMGASAIEMGKKVAGMPTPNWRGFEDKLPAWVKKEDYLRMAREGHLDPQNIYMIKGLERGKGGVASGIWGNIESAAGWFAEVSESMNRRSTMIAAFRVAHDMGDAKLKAKGFDSKYDFAVSIIQQTQGIYNKGNRSGLARGNGKLGQYGPLILVFKQFTINYTEQMIRHGKDKEVKSLAVAMMWQFALAGMLGLPFADDLRDLFEGIAYRVFGKAFNLPDYLEGLLGKSNADALMYGLASEKGRIDLFGRSSLGNVIPGTDVIRPGPTDWAEILGASSGFYESFFSAASMAADGHYKDALITASPRYIRDAASGAEIAMTGSYRNTKGDKIMDLDKTDAVIKSMAFNPSNNARPGRDRSNAYNMKNMLKAKTDYFSKHLAEAMYQENDERLDELYNEMDAWNDKNAEHFNVDIDKIEKSAEKRVERKDFGSAERQNVQDSLAQRQDDLAGT